MEIKFYKWFSISSLIFQNLCNNLFFLGIKVRVFILFFVFPIIHFDVLDLVIGVEGYQKPKVVKLRIKISLI